MVPQRPQQYWSFQTIPRWEIPTNGHSIDFDIYVQRVHIGYGNKTITYALTFVVDTGQQDLGINLIEDLVFDKSYNRLTFHPFVSQNILSHRVVQLPFQKHNAYQNSACKLNINGTPQKEKLR